jgi:hypothetical protein
MSYLTENNPVPAEQGQLCAVVSKNNGEDPIGTAPHFDQLLVLELPPPWPGNVWQAGQTPEGLRELFQHAGEQGLRLVAQAILPNPIDGSRPGWTRLFSFHRPPGPVATYGKEEFIVPNREVTDVVEALLLSPGRVPNFEPYRQDTTHLREILVCTHGNRDVCCGKFGFPMFHALRQIAASAARPFRVWRTSHLGGHRFAPTLLDLPEGRCWGHLDLETLEKLALRRGRVLPLRRFYRGWSALAPHEQVAEREVFMRIGREWLHYLKEIHTLELDETKDYARIWLGYTAPDGQVGGAYEATVEFSHWVSTLLRSGDPQPTPVKQYRVSRLVKTLNDPAS